MNLYSKRVIFGAAIIAGMSLVLAKPLYEKLKRPPPARVVHLHANIAVSEQLRPEELPELRDRGFTTIIDLRPDGEAVGQTPSTVMASSARANRMEFVYVPVPHGAIADSAVAALDKALSQRSGEVLLYCRSGKRAARTWALVEASRAKGMDSRAILAAVKASGQSADDLTGNIAERVAKRRAGAQGVQR